MILQMVQRQTIDVDALFSAAVLAENSGHITEAEDTYQLIMKSDPFYAPAFINLGTIRFKSGDFAAAKELYERAVEIDSQYALGFFNLASVLDEFGHEEESASAYKRAIALGHIDAHYNLALLYRESGLNRSALPHWKAYLKSDQNSSWADYARNQIKVILSIDCLQFVR